VGGSAGRPASGGSRILYNHSTDAGPGGTRTDIYTVPAAGGPTSRLSRGAGEKFAGSYSPDGKRIVFVAGGVVGTLSVMRADGSGAKPLGSAGLIGSCPRFSPGGGRIAYRAGEFGEIWVINADGTGRRRISGSSTDYDQCPSWSPDGRSLTFVRYKGFSDADVWVMRADGRGAKQLTTDGDTKTSAAWSPNGRSIAYDRGGNIWVMRADGRAQRPITDTVEHETEPIWSPRSDRIAYARSNGPVFELWITTLRGSARPLGVQGSPAGWRAH
jgi:Tol biopolymer transport system component